VHPNDGEGQQTVLGIIEPGKTYHCIIKYEDQKYKFYFQDIYWECDAGTNPTWGYMLNPFIGGVFTLNHDWSIDIVDIKRSNPDSLGALEPGF
jgi:hypothetical protein